MAGKFELYFDDAKQYRFRLTGDDGATLMTSEPYTDKPTAVSGINGIRDCASTALISDLTDGDGNETE
ncbi:hypothetical protein ASH00_15055 [Arthrobacter sp. Soil782]|uniref:YegP family protein n=1 Tax=Arthrobacter sp. Soil782 TaxID=1736410 RepID=UPI0007019E47|nr:DUF1508 domain-containing protein [Arthrobacter sp. Soil782]KRF03977.1 hypothetical protein ASH00_15055 [Arthrobacter sp. Soil782]